MQHIETVTVGSGGAASITFSAIPDTFTDLYVVCSVRTNRGIATFDGINIKINGSTANFSWRRLSALDGSLGSGNATNGESVYATSANATANTFGSGQIYIPNYRSSVAKSISAESVTENNATNNALDIRAMLWNDTTAITSIELYSATSSTLQQYSSASLYGVTAGSSGGVVVS